MLLDNSSIIPNGRYSRLLPLIGTILDRVTVPELHKTYVYSDYPHCTDWMIK
jgi:hypothetical protein